MPSEALYDVAIAGAGPTGLAAAWRIAGAGRSVVVVDAAPDPGGLCRTLEWDGLRFDVGGHRFTTRFADVHDLVEHVAGDEMIEVARKSRIHLGDRFLDFPPTVGGTLSTVPLVGLRAGLHSLSGGLFGFDPERALDLGTHLRRQFGDALYELVFRDYTRKVWGLPPEEMSPDWADARVGGLSLGGLLRRALGRRGAGGPRAVETFRYPALGYGRVFHRMADEVRARGGEIVLGAPIDEVRLAADGAPHEIVAAGGRRWRARTVLATLPLAVLVSRLRPDAPEGVLQAALALRYRALVLLVLRIRGGRMTDDTWLYFPGNEPSFCRIHEPGNWSPRLIPDGTGCVVVEFFCTEGDALWKRTDDDLAAEAVSGLHSAGLLDPARVDGHRTWRFPRAYPVYDTRYRALLDQVERVVDGIPGLHRAGRAGTFAYLSSDECMRQGLLAGERLSCGTPAPTAVPVLGHELILLCAQGLEPEEGAVDRLVRTLVRRGADVVSGTIAPADARSALLRFEQIVSPESIPWSGLAVVRRSAWEEAGGGTAGEAQVLSRLAADPTRVLMRDGEARARATAAWWKNIPLGPARNVVLGVRELDLRTALGMIGLGVAISVPLTVVPPWLLQGWPPDAPLAWIAAAATGTGLIVYLVANLPRIRAIRRAGFSWLRSLLAAARFEQ